METNPFMIEVAHTNIQSNTEINGLLSDFFYPYIRSLPGVSTLILVCITMVEVLVIFINADRRIKGLQIGDHETKLC